MSPPATALTMPDYCVTSPSACGWGYPPRGLAGCRIGHGEGRTWRGGYVPTPRPSPPTSDRLRKWRVMLMLLPSIGLKQFSVLPHPAANAMYETRGGISMKQAGHSPAARSSEVEKRISPAKIFPRPGLGRPRPLARPLARRSPAALPSLCRSSAIHPHPVSALHSVFGGTSGHKVRVPRTDGRTDVRSEDIDGQYLWKVVPLIVRKCSKLNKCCTLRHSITSYPSSFSRAILR